MHLAGAESSDVLVFLVEVFGELRVLDGRVVDGGQWVNVLGFFGGDGVAVLIVLYLILTVFLLPVDEWFFLAITEIKVNPTSSFS